MKRTRTAEASENRRRKRSLVPGCLGVGCGLPIVGALILWLVFLLNNRAPIITVPTPPSLANNAYDDFLHAAQMTLLIKHKSPASMNNPPTDRAGLRKVSAACAKDAAPALVIMRQGLSKPCQEPAVRSLNSTVGTMGHHASLRELARTILGVELFYQLSNQPGKAMETMLDGEEMAVMIPHGGALLSELVGFACESICLCHFEEVLPRLSPTEVAHVAVRLDRIAAKRQSYADVALEESNVTTAEWIEMLRDPQNQSLKARYTMIRENIGWQQGHNPSLQENWKIARFVLADKTGMLQQNQAFFKAIAEEARKPFTGKSQVPVPNNFMAFNNTWIVEARARHIGWEAVLDLFRIEAALYRYKAASGRFPSSLSQLIPTYLQEVPTDPFTGIARQPYRYVAKDGAKTFLLYGLGADMADNAGLPTRRPGASEKGDIVAGRLGFQRTVH